MIGRIRISVIALLSVLVGCGPVSPSVDVKFDQKQFDDALAMLTRMDNSLNRATNEITDESKKWRETLTELEKQFVVDGQDTLSHEVKYVAEVTAASLGTQGNILTEHLEAQIKANLEAFREAIKTARQDIETAKGKKDKNGISQALDRLAKTKVYLDPVVTAFIPQIVEVKWDEAKTSSTPRQKHIEIHGWGLEPRPGQKLPFVASIRGADDSVRPLSHDALSVGTRYKCLLTLPSDVFHPDDKKLLIYLSPDDARELPIDNVFAVAKVEEPPKMIKKIILTVKTTGDDKDKEIAFYWAVGTDKENLGHSPEPAKDNSNGGHNDLWPNNDSRDIVIELKKPLPWNERLNASVYMEYRNWRGNHGWEGRMVAKGVLENGEPTPMILSDTGDFKLGENGNPHSRVFRFNQ